MLPRSPARVGKAKQLELKPLARVLMHWPMHVPIRLIGLVASAFLAVGHAQDDRRMAQELQRLVQEERPKYPVDPRLDDLSPEERANIEPAPPAVPPPPADALPADAEENVVRLAPVIVEERRVSPLTWKLRELDRAAAAEQARTVPTTLDWMLNHPRISIFGPYNAATRAAIARRNLRVMSMERMLLVAIQAAETEAEKAELRGYLAEMQAMRR
jgi:hypothetical protein